MSVVPLLSAITYLLLVGVGFVGALLLLVWLFRETPTGARAGRETTRSVRNAKPGEEGTPSTLAETEFSKDKAAQRSAVSLPSFASSGLRPHS